MNTVLRSASVLALFAVALAANAAPTLTLLPATFLRPTSGSANVSIVGTLTTTVGDTITQFDEVAQLIGPAGSAPRFNNGVNFSQIQAALNATGTYTGPLITYGFSNVDPLGTYTHQTDGIFFRLASGNSNTANPVVNLVAQPTPEPSALAALGLGAVAFVKRRKRA